MKSFHWRQQILQKQTILFSKSRVKFLMEILFSCFLLISSSIKMYVVSFTLMLFNSDSLKRTNCLETEVQNLDYLEHFGAILHARFIFRMSFSLKFQSFCALIILFCCINCSLGVSENKEFGSHAGVTSHLQWKIKPYAATYWTKLSRLLQWSKLQTWFPH